MVVMQCTAAPVAGHSGDGLDPEVVIGTGEIDAKVDGVRNNHKWELRRGKLILRSQIGWSQSERTIPLDAAGSLEAQGESWSAPGTFRLQLNSGGAKVIFYFPSSSALRTFALDLAHSLLGSVARIVNSDEIPPSLSGSLKLVSKGLKEERWTQIHTLEDGIYFSTPAPPSLHVPSLLASTLGMYAAYWGAYIVLGELFCQCGMSYPVSTILAFLLLGRGLYWRCEEYSRKLAFVCHPGLSKCGFLSEGKLEGLIGVACKALEDVEGGVSTVVRLSDSSFLCLLSFEKESSEDTEWKKIDKEDREEAGETRREMKEAIGVLLSGIGNEETKISIFETQDQSRSWVSPLLFEPVCLLVCSLLFSSSTAVSWKSTRILEKFKDLLKKSEEMSGKKTETVPPPISEEVVAKSGKNALEKIKDVILNTSFEDAGSMNGVALYTCEGYRFQGDEEVKVEEGKSLPLLVKGVLNFGTDFSLEEVKNYLTSVDLKVEWDSMFEKGRVLAEYNADLLDIGQTPENQQNQGLSKGLALTYEAFWRQFGVAGRDVVHSTAWTFDDEKGELWVSGETIESDLYPPQCFSDSHVRAYVHLGGFYAKRVEGGGGEIEVSFVNQVDVNGHIPGWLLKQVQRLQPANLYHIREKMKKKFLK